MLCMEVEKHLGDAGESAPDKNIHLFKQSMYKQVKIKSLCEKSLNNTNGSNAHILNT